MAEKYLAERTGLLEYRFIRYAAVADALEAMGMNDSHLLVDVGAGMCDFDFYLRTVRGWKGRYLPIDASISGVDFENIKLDVIADYTTAIEVIEHVKNAEGLIGQIQDHTSSGMVFTTPNTGKLGEDYVYAMDRTHIRPWRAYELGNLGFETEIKSFFGQEQDSILARKDLRGN